MSFFEKKVSPSPPSPQPSFKPPTGPSRGDRLLGQRIREPDAPEARKHGLTNAAVLEIMPHGCLFKVSGGWFDLRGFWCVSKGDGVVEVRRGSPKKVLKLLTADQRHELGRVRLNARRHGLR